MNKKEFQIKLIEDRTRDINNKEVVEASDVKRYKQLMERYNNLL